MAEISKGRKIVSRFEQLRNEKNLYEFEFQDIAEFMAPNKANFTKTFSPGLNRRERLFDSTAERALGIFAASLMAFLVNPATRWFDLKTLNPEANKIHDNAVWLDFASQRLLNAFNEPNARFYGHMFRALTDIGAFGNAGMFTLEGTVTDLAFRALPLSELYFLENSEGVVNTKYRLISMSFRQIKLKAEKDGWILNDKFERLHTKNPFDTTNVIHAVTPREDAELDSLGSGNMPWSSCWVWRDQAHVFKQSGFNEDPIAIGRWDIDAGESYAKGPGHVALADVKTVNAMSKSNLMAAEKVLMPPLMVHDDGVMGIIDLSAGAKNVVKGKGSSTRPPIEPIHDIGNLPISFDMEKARREAINKAFFVDVLQLVGETEMTATEVLTRTNEKGRMIAPSIGLLQSEFLGPIIERSFSILTRSGAIPPPPDSLIGEDLRIVYVSPLSRAQREEEAQAIIAYYNALSIIGSTDPTILDNVSGDDAARELHDIMSVPAKTLRSKEDVDNIRESRVQQQEEQKLVEQAQQISEIAKNAGQSGILGD